MNEVFAAVDLSGLLVGVLPIVVLLISLVMVVFGFRMVRNLLDDNRYTLWKKDDSGLWFFDNTGEPRKKGFWE